MIFHKCWPEVPILHCFFELWEKVWEKSIPDICHFFYTGKIFRDKILHPKARKSRQNGFRDKIA